MSSNSIINLNAKPHAHAHTHAHACDAAEEEDSSMMTESAPVPVPTVPVVPVPHPHPPLPEEDTVVWDANLQIYVGGRVPEANDRVRALLQKMNKQPPQDPHPPPEEEEEENVDVEEGDSSLSLSLRIFGYGSLCWNAGERTSSILAHPRVSTRLGRVHKYQRCWAQKSTDHRGVPAFPGIVCTLLHDSELKNDDLSSLRQQQQQQQQRRLRDKEEEEAASSTSSSSFSNHVDTTASTTATAATVGTATATAVGATATTTTTTGSRTLGRVYTVPADLVPQCLHELDFREKGGYARDVIPVVSIMRRDEEASSDPAVSASASATTTTTTVDALLYRGTPDNPALWRRAWLDKAFAAAVISVAVGPSGENLEYLEQLNAFLHLHNNHDNHGNDDNDDDDDTTRHLTQLARTLRDQQQHRDALLVFMTGAGSNQYNQLLLQSLIGNHEEVAATEMTETVALLIKSVHNNHSNNQDHNTDGTDTTEEDEKKIEDNDDTAVQVLAGGAHSGILTSMGRLFLFGSNEHGQLGYNHSPRDASRGTHHHHHENTIHNIDDRLLVLSSMMAREVVAEPEWFLQEEGQRPIPVKSETKSKTPRRPMFLVECASLGFAHTLLIEKGTGRLVGFGDNSKGQVDGSITPTPKQVSYPITPSWARMKTILPTTKPSRSSRNDRDDHDRDWFVSVSAGVYHSAAVTRDGEVVVWGCPRSTGIIPQLRNVPKGIIHHHRWKPHDGSRFVQVLCGRHHTVMIDDKGRAWTVGGGGAQLCNKYGQLGRPVNDHDPNDRAHVSWSPQLVMDLPYAAGYRVKDVSVGWSHTIVVLQHVYHNYNNYDTTSSHHRVVFGWGRNDHGQLGMRSRHDNGQHEHEYESRPIRLFSLHNIESVACGSESTCIVDRSGTLWSTGWNEHGNLGVGDCMDRFELSKVTGAPFMLSRPPSSVLRRKPSKKKSNGGRGEMDPVHACLPTRTLVAMGGSHLLALKIEVPITSS